MRFALKMLTLVICLVASSHAQASNSFRYRTTVTIATPEGDRSGSAVREVTASFGWSPLPESGATAEARGEAVVIDLGKRGYVFALLSSPFYNLDYAVSMPGRVMFPNGGWLTKESFSKIKTFQSRQWLLGLKDYPDLVIFRDIKKPDTLERLIESYRCPDPVTKIPRTAACLKKDYFEEKLGKGVSLKSITIEVTDEPFSKPVVEKVLPWIKNYREKYFEIDDEEVEKGYPPVNTFRRRNFIQ